MHVCVCVCGLVYVSAPSTALTVLYANGKSFSSDFIDYDSRDETSSHAAGFHLHYGVHLKSTYRKIQLNNITSRE